MSEALFVLCAFFVLSLLAVTFWVIPWAMTYWAEMRPSLRQSAKDWRAATERAELLLAEMLTREQYALLRRQGYLEVPSPSIPNRVYRIPKYQGRVHVYEGGKGVESLCLQPTMRIPDADIVLMHKLMIEGNEPEYLRMAHHFAGSPTLFRHQL